MQHPKRTMMILLSSLFAISILTACTGQVSTVKNTSIDLTSGKLVYNVSGEGTSSAWEFEVMFNQGNVLINETYARGASKKYNYSKSTGEILALINDVATFGISKNSYFIYYTPEELVRLGLSSNYGDTAITITQEFKEIAGYNCQKWIINHGEHVTVEVWLTDKIKTGVILPWTPLTFEKTALEYEIKILGKVDRRYEIKSISDEKRDETIFEHSVPDEYHEVVPASVFSLDSTWANDYKENEFSSFTYPYFGDGREATKQYIQSGLLEILKGGLNEKMTIEFFVLPNGALENIEINYGEKSNYSGAVKAMLQKMPKWTPAKVKGKPVKASVVIVV